MPSSLFLLFKIVLASQSVSCFHMNFKMFFYVCKELNWHFDWDSFVFIDFSGRNFHTINSTTLRAWNMEGLSIFWCVIQFGSISKLALERMINFILIQL